MNVINLVILIRVLFVLGMICLLVFAGAWLNRGEGRSVSKSGGDAPRNPKAGPAIVWGNPGYPVAEARQESIDAPRIQRRAA